MKLKHNNLSDILAARREEMQRGKEDAQRRKKAR